MTRKTKHKKKRKHVAHHRRKHPLPFNFISGFIYAGAAIAFVTLGGFFYKGVKNAEKDLKASKPRAVASSHLPPGATVVKKRTGKRMTSHRSAPAPHRSQPKKAAPKPTRTTGATPEEEPAKQVARPAHKEPPAPATPLEAPSPNPQPCPAWEFSAESLLQPQTATVVPSADTTVFTEPLQRRNQNAGAEEEIILKGIASFALTRYDIEPIRGWTILKATWHGKVTKGTIRQLGFSTILADWHEGTGKLGSDAADGATWKWADFGRTPWTHDQGSVASITRGNGASIISCGVPDNTHNQTNEWIAVEIDPILVQALVAGATYGLAISDEKGQVSATPATVLSRSSSSPYYIEVEGQLMDIAPPGRIEQLGCFSHPQLKKRNSTGVILSWIATGDDGNKGQAFRYDIRYTARSTGFGRAVQIPLAQTPLPPMPAGEQDQVVIHGLDPSTDYTFFIRAVDKAGQPGPITEAEFTTGPRLVSPSISKPVSYKVEALPLFDRTLTLQILDEESALDPIRGNVSTSLGPDHPPKSTSLFWERNTRTINLTAARNETLGFQMIFGREAPTFPPVKFTTGLFNHPKDKPFDAKARFYKLAYHVGPPAGRRKVLIGDALVPLKNNRLALTSRELLPQQAYQSVYTEFHVPASATPGAYRSTITLSSGETEDVTLNIFLNVLPVALPDQPQFTIELLGTPNTASLYGKSAFNSTDALPIEREYHRAAREHRCTLALLPYKPNGDCPKPFGLPVSGKSLDTRVTSWSAWEERFGSYLDGTAYQDLSAGTAPSPHFILPVFENWPTPLNKGYTCKGEDVPDPLTGNPLYAAPSSELAQCFDLNYWRAMRAVLDQFGDRFAGKGWRSTTAHIWLDNTPTDLYRGTSPPWSFGQPRYRDDFLALETYASNINAGKAADWPTIRPQFRIHVPDAMTLQGIGRGQFNILTVDSGDTAAWEQLRDRALAYNETLWLQSDTLPFDRSTASIPAMGIAYFLAGADGWSIRNVIGGKSDWRRTRGGALLCSGAPKGVAHPYPSLRLKALRRTQQDIELMLLLQEKKGWSRAQLRDVCRPHFPDCPGGDYKASNEDLFRLRRVVQRLLTE